MVPLIVVVIVVCGWVMDELGVTSTTITVFVAWIGKGVELDAS